MSDELNKLVEASKRHCATPEEMERQRRSFAFGNTHFENERITRDTVDQAAEALKSEKDRRPAR